MDKLEYGWWERKRGVVKVPPFIGDERNFTLTSEELLTYGHLLGEMKQVIEKEYAAASLNYRAVTTGKVPYYESSPRCTSICDVLEFKVAHMKKELALMQLMSDICKQRIAEKKNAVASTDPIPDADPTRCA